MTNYVRETKSGKSISAYVVLNKKGATVATVQAHFSDGGTVTVNIFHADNTPFQSSKASGYGYDKFTAALNNLTIDGHAMTNHCSRLKAPKPPKGCKLFPRDYKPRKGYSLANFTRISRATGNTFYRDHWITKAYEKLGIADASDDIKNDRWHDVAPLARELELEWESSDDCESGYRDCYRKEGLEYLKAIGYRVIQAI